MSIKYFTPVSGLLGGSLIGLSAATLLLFNGDILGASGLASAFILAPRATLTNSKHQWKLCFIAAFALTTRLYVGLIDPDALKDERLAYSRNVPIVSPLGFAVGGFLVGFGTRLGNGCTTGHGICGMARLSLRSFTAVVSFMATGLLSSTACSTTCLFYPYLRTSYASVAKHLPTEATITVGTVLASVAAGAALPSAFRSIPSRATAEEKEEIENDYRKIGPSIISGSLFSLGLVISKMTMSSKVYGFLNVKSIRDGTWDPTLVCVMGGGFLVSFLSYQWVKGFQVFKHSGALECPVSQKGKSACFNVPTNKTIDNNLIVGEALFGLGWGFSGLCPGPAMFMAFAGYPNVLFRWWPSFFVGSLLAEQVKAAQMSKEAKNK